MHGVIGKGVLRTCIILTGKQYLNLFIGIALNTFVILVASKNSTVAVAQWLFFLDMDLLDDLFSH
jgi:hypothetical protein